MDFLSTVLGIKPSKPGFEEILIKPQFIYDYAKGQMPTVQGMVKVEWRKDGDRVELSVEGPEGLPVAIQLPDQEMKKFPDGGCISLQFC